MAYDDIFVSTDWLAQHLDDPDLAARLGAERERLRGLSIVWSERTGEIVTVLRPRRGPASRRRSAYAATSCRCSD